MEEQQYLQNLKNGDEKALDYFFNTYYKYMVVTSYNILKDDFKAKDIVQDVFFRFWQKRETLEVSNVKAYLRRAVYNKSIDEIRKLNRQGWTEELNEIDAPISNAHIHEEMEANELQDKINQAIDDLPERCRIIFSLSRFENLSHKEIGQKLDISVKTIENQMTKALKRIRKAISGMDLLLIILTNFLGYWINYLNT